MADNRKYYYLKLKEDFFDTDEMKILESMKDGYLYSNILLKLYLKSLSNSGRLMYRNVIPYTPEILATLTGHQVGTVEKALDVFKKLDLIEIQWNKEELEAAVRAKIAGYENVVYTEENIKAAKNDRAELNKLIKAIEERRKQVKNIINEPYAVFEAELKEITALINEPVALIDQQVKAFEEKQKEEKKAAIKATYDENIGDLAEVLPFEKIFDSRYLNQTYKLATAQKEIVDKIDTVKTDLETIDSLDSKYKLNAKDVYIKTLDLSKALAENKRLADLEEKLEADKRRKAEEEVERKRQEEIRKQKEAEEQAKREAEEAERKAAEAKKAQEAAAEVAQTSATRRRE